MRSEYRANQALHSTYTTRADTRAQWAAVLAPCHKPPVRTARKTVLARLFGI